MSTISYSATLLRAGQGIGSSPFGNQIVWSGMTNLDSGQVVDQTFIPWSDRCVQIEGTFSVGGTIVIEGSNDATNYHTLTDPLGNSLSFTASAIKQINEIVTNLRPRVTAGDGSTSLTVTLFCRSTNQ